MRIRFLKDHGMYHPGMVTDQIQGGVADILIRRRIAEPVPLKVQVIEEPVVEVVEVPVPAEGTDPVETNDEPKAAKPRTRK